MLTAKEAAAVALEDLFQQDLAELEEIEAERAAAVARGERLNAELEEATRDLDATRAALQKLPDQMSAAQLAGDHLRAAEIQDTHARLSAALEDAEARHEAAKERHEQGFTSERQAAAEAARRAWAVKERAERLREAAVSELDTLIAPVLEQSRRASERIQVLQSYGGGR